MYTNILAAALLANVAFAVPHMNPADRRKAVANGARAHLPSQGFPKTSTGSAQPKPTSTSSAAPMSTGGAGAGSNTYTRYSGDGSVAQGWPDENKWVSDFETMWQKNLPTIQNSCTNLPQHVSPDNSEQETQQVHDAIQSAASAAQMDPRFVLAIMMQESKGCVRVPTTNNGNANPGLMQSGGKASCNSGSPMNPCPQSTIQDMINDGINGPSGLKPAFGQAPGPGNAQKFYQTAFRYNSGPNSPLTGNLAASDGTASYASDVANRLTGFVGNPPQ